MRDMVTICNTGVPHQYEPDLHICCKLRYWRDQGAPAITLQGGREQWHNEPSIGAREKQAVADARSVGIEPERV